MTKPTLILNTAAKTLVEREEQYGDADPCFDRISKLATIILNKPISQYDVAMIQVATKLGRLQEARNHDDNYIDAINYMAFGAQFAALQGSIETAVEDDFAAIARKFAPRRANIPNAPTPDTASYSSPINEPPVAGG
jgi:hypothetical protein